jgi:hypothetical protein
MPRQLWLRALAGTALGASVVAGCVWRDARRRHPAEHGHRTTITTTTTTSSSSAPTTTTPETTTTTSPPPPPVGIATRQASMEDGTFAEFTDAEAAAGSLTIDDTHGYAGSRSGHARYTGGGTNGFARAEQDVHWSSGQEVWYSGAFFLPTGFAAAQQGQVSLMRWDNWSIDPDTTDQGGLVMHSDGRLVLVRQQPGGAYAEVSERVAVPEGRWLWIEVRQVLSDQQGVARNELWVDGRLASSSDDANTFGRDITRLRWGVVSIGAGGQTNDLELWFDRATVSTGRIGPVG